MKCIVCNEDTFVTDSRKGPDNTIRRRRVCRNLHRFSTKEVISDSCPLTDNNNAPVTYKCPHCKSELTKHLYQTHIMKTSRPDAE